MAAYRFSQAARAYVTDILAYIVQDSPRAATKLLGRLEQHAERLAAAPGLGRSRTELRPGLRSAAMRSSIGSSPTAS